MFLLIRGIGPLLSLLHQPRMIEYEVVSGDDNWEEKPCPSAVLSANLTSPDLGSNAGRCGKAARNLLCYSTTIHSTY
jgi:hypothetical protein